MINFHLNPQAQSIIVQFTNIQEAYRYINIIQNQLSLRVELINSQDEYMLYMSGANWRHCHICVTHTHTVSHTHIVVVSQHSQSSSSSVLCLSLSHLHTYRYIYFITVYFALVQFLHRPTIRFPCICSLRVRVCVCVCAIDDNGSVIVMIVVPSQHLSPAERGLILSISMPEYLSYPNEIFIFNNCDQTRPRSIFNYFDYSFILQFYM